MRHFFRQESKWTINHSSRWNWILLVLLLVYSCSKDEENEPQTLVQVSTIDALMNGVYDGPTPLSKLKKYGDFGIGTFNTLDGEMIFLDHVFYQIKADGKVYKPGNTTQTPFAAVTFFYPDIKYSMSNVSYDRLKTITDSLMLSANLFYAVKVHGTFSTIRTRSVPAQQKPYPPLVQVTANQPEFEAQSVSGTLAGFYCPPYVSGVNVVGYHLHFLSDDKKFGGHVLSFQMDKGTLLLDQIPNFRLFLPEEGDFLNTDLNGDQSGDVDEAEGK